MVLRVLRGKEPNVAKLEITLSSNLCFSRSNRNLSNATKIKDWNNKLFQKEIQTMKEMAAFIRTTSIISSLLYFLGNVDSGV
jgi:hypothetical protein